MPLPSYVDSERALIGALLTGTKETQEWVCSELTVGDFQDMEHQKAYKAIQSILDESLEVTKVSVKDRARLKATSVEEMCNAAAGVSSGSLKTIIRDLRNASQLRSIAGAFTDALDKCQDGESPDSVLAGVETRLYSTGGSQAYKASDAKDVATRAAHTFADKVDGKAPPALSTGLRLLDRAIIGLRPGKSYVIAGRPAMGKSAVAQTISHAVLEQEGGVLTFTGEMTEEDVINRALSYYSGVNLRRIISGKDLGPGEAAAVYDAANKIPADRWRIIDRLMPPATMMRVARIEAAKMRRKGIKLQLCVVDYLQLYAEGESREQAVAAVSSTCKRMAKELECSVLALSQLNRGVENRESKKPVMADLRESGAIEQDADAVIFVYRDCVYNKEASEEEGELIVGKNRDGPPGPVPVRYVAKTTTFTDPLNFGIQHQDLSTGTPPNV
jgi:replicative DNA helicase